MPKLPVLQQLAGVSKRRVEGEVVIHLDQSVLGQTERLAMLDVALVGEGNDGVDAVVAAVQFHDNQHPAIASRCRGTGGAGEKVGDGRRQRDQGGAAQGCSRNHDA